MVRPALMASVIGFLPISKLGFSFSCLDALRETLSSAFFVTDVLPIEDLRPRNDPSYS